MATPRQEVFRKYLELDQPDDQVFCTYVFVDGKLENLRSKMRVLSYEPKTPEECPTSTFCGKGTFQWPDAGADSELFLSSVALFRDPFLGGRNKLVLCEVLNSDLQPNETNTRRPCKKAMEATKDEAPWFGIEQEYVILEQNGMPIGWPKDERALKTCAHYYHGVGPGNIAGRQIADAHAKACAYAGVKLYGSDPEAFLSQWEYQVGPLPGVEAGDHLWISRYILQRVAEDFDVTISLEPLPFKTDRLAIGSGQINFSTRTSRGEGGLEWIMQALHKLELSHEQHLAVYDPRNAQSNDERVQRGLPENSNGRFLAAFCSKMEGVSVRVPRRTQLDGRGYIEDRRPGANVEPYRAMQALVETLCLAK